MRKYIPTYMTKRLTAVLLAGVASAFNGGKWKVDADGKLAVDGEGNPIYVGSDGSEKTVAGDTISRLNQEAKGHRERAEAAEAKLEPFKGLDATKAREALDTVGKIDQKKLIDAGEVDRVREQIRSEMTGQLTEKDNALKETTSKLHGLTIKTALQSSDFVRDQLAVPFDMFEASFGKNFKVNEKGEIEAYDRAGNRLLSKTKAGEYADPNEAIGLLIEAHPQKDMIIKAQQGNGTGNNGGGGNRGTGNVMKRADFDAMNGMEKAAAAKQMQAGEISLVD